MLPKIRRYRREIMGVAILWIMAFHANITFPNFLFPLEIVFSAGFGGADIFFFLSGFGLVCGGGLVRDGGRTFFMSRALRILPTYWVVVLLQVVINLSIRAKEINLLDIVAVLTGCNFLLYGQKGFWFIPAILVCYLLFPAIWRVIRFDRPELYVSCGIGVAVILSIAISMSNYHHLLILTTRLPIFILGMFAGFVLVNNIASTLFDDVGHISKCLLLGFVMLGTSWILNTTDSMWRYGLWWYPFLLMTYPICIIVALLCEYMDKVSEEKSFARAMYGCVSYCGTYSLQVYLLHMITYSLGPVWLGNFSSIESEYNPGRVPEYALYTVIAIASAGPLSRVVSWMFHPMFQRLNVPPSLSLESHIRMKKAA